MSLNESCNGKTNGSGEEENSRRSSFNICWAIKKLVKEKLRIVGEVKKGSSKELYSVSGLMTFHFCRAQPEL
ncbi:unnamed protein product [Caretta caretta]